MADNEFSAYEQRLLLRDLHQLQSAPSSTSSSSPWIFDDAIHADIDNGQLWKFVEYVNELVHASYTVYQYCEGDLYLREFDLELLRSDLEHNFTMACNVNISIADQADALRHPPRFTGNEPLVCPFAEVVNRECLKRYTEVQLLYDEVKFKIDTIIADPAASASSAVVEKVGSFTASPAPQYYQKEVEENDQPHSLATRRTLDFDSPAVQVSSPEVGVEASSATASPEARATGHALAPAAAPLAAATVPLEEGVVEASSVAASPEARARARTTSRAGARCDGALRGGGGGGEQRCCFA